MPLSASDMSPKLRGVPGSAPTLIGDIPVSSVKEPLPPQHDAASASKKHTDERTHHLSKSDMQQSTKKEANKKSKEGSSLK